MDSSRRGDGAVPLALVVMSRCRRNLRNAVLVLSRGGRDGSCRGDEIHRRIALALLRRRRGIFALAQKRRAVRFVAKTSVGIVLTATGTFVLTTPGTVLDPFRFF